MATSADTYDWGGYADEIVAVVLEGVEQPGLRRILEHVVREGDLQRACILKQMYADWLHVKP